MKKENQSEAEILRKKAEILLNKKTPETPSPFSEIEMLKLIHELEVHQVELELQNDELLRARTIAEVATNKYTNLYEFAPSGYFTLSTGSEIIEMNITGTQMLGKNRSKLINHRFTLFVAPDTRLVFNLFLEKVFQSKIQETCEVKLIVNVDIPKYVLLTGIITENQKQCNITMVDISERKLLEDKLLAEQVFRSSIEVSLSSGIAIVDKNGKQIYVNPSFCRLLGWSEEELIGRTAPYVYWPVQHLQSIEKAFQTTLANKAPKEGFELVFISKDGILIPVQVVISPFNNGKELIGWLANVICITERKQAERELIKAKERAEESDHLKSAFLANMSHEIRTPMNGILGFAALLKEPNRTGEEQQKYIRIIEKSGKRMLNIINDIVDISKIESGQMGISIAESNINEQIEYIYTFFKPEVEAKTMHLFFKNSLPEKESLIKTDCEKIYAILTNLVKNAIKYTKEGSIEFGYEKKGEYLEFFVKDTGIGIARNRQAAIFERFIQADIFDKQAYQGAGLGLSIAKAYVEMLGGKIWVESELEKGSTFYFTIPYNTEKQEQNSLAEVISKEDETGQIKNLKTLIAEDEEVSDLLLTLMLKEISREVIHARTGGEAVDACRNNPDLDLILIDILMPGMNGYEATRQIRGFNKDVIIIAQTAHGLSGDRQKAIDAGCNEYLSKPIDKDELMRLMQQYFSVEQVG